VRRSLLLVLAGCVGVALVHVLLRSMVNSGHPWGPVSAWPKSIENAVQLHATWEPFAKRPLMNNLLRALAAITSWSAWTRFVIAQLAALAWAAIEMLLTARRVAAWRGDEPTDVWRVLLMFFVFPPVLFAWLTPVYTFDDLLVAALLLRAVRAVVDERWIAAAIVLAIAAVSHEVALFVIPSVAWLAWDVSAARTDRKLRVAALLLLPAICWLVVRELTHADQMEGWYLNYQVNFGTPTDAISSIGAVILALGLPAVLLASCRPARPPHLARYYVAAIALTLPLLALATFLRELRLLALPGYLVLPFLGPVIRWSTLRLHDRWQVLAAVACGAAAAFVYHPVITSSPLAFRLALGLLVGLAASVALARVRR
jgi:hypothetical protein